MKLCSDMALQGIEYYVENTYRVSGTASGEIIETDINQVKLIIGSIKKKIDETNNALRSKAKEKFFSFEPLNFHLWIKGDLRRYAPSENINYYIDTYYVLNELDHIQYVVKLIHDDEDYRSFSKFEEMQIYRNGNLIVNIFKEKYFIFRINQDKYYYKVFYNNDKPFIIKRLFRGIRLFKNKFMHKSLYFEWKIKNGSLYDRNKQVVGTIYKKYNARYISYVNKENELEAIISAFL